MAAPTLFNLRISSRQFSSEEPLRPLLTLRIAMYALTLLAILPPGQTAFAQGARTLRPYVAPSKLYAVQKPADWKVVETAQPNLLRVQIASPEGTASVDFAWVRNDQGRSNALRYLVAYRQLLSRTWPDVTFSDVHASRDNLQALASVTFHDGAVAIRGRYYFESDARKAFGTGLFRRRACCQPTGSPARRHGASLTFMKNGPPSRSCRHGATVLGAPALAMRTAENARPRLHRDCRRLRISSAASGGVMSRRPPGGGPGACLYMPSGKTR